MSNEKLLPEVLQRMKTALAAENAAPPSILCPDCGRYKAMCVEDCSAGFCPKWYAVRDDDAAKDCRKHTQTTNAAPAVSSQYSGKAQARGGSTPQSDEVTAGAAPTPESTPETDARLLGDDNDMVNADFARQLERERDEAAKLVEIRADQIRCMTKWLDYITDILYVATMHSIPQRLIDAMPAFAAEEVAKKDAQIARLRADAERYQWIRSERALEWIVPDVTDDEFDAAIDAAKGGK